jgi:hypothetical protein
MVQGWLMEGATATYTSQEILFGWETTIAEKVNGGDFWQGADFDTYGWINVIYSTDDWLVANATYNLYSGSLTTDDVSQVRLLNGQAYLNKITPIFNGTYSSMVP